MASLPTQPGPQPPGTDISSGAPAFSGLGSAPLKRRRHEIAATLPSFGWLVLFVLAPTLLVLAIAFRVTDPSGGIGSGWTTGQFAVFGQGSTMLLVWRTLWISALTTALCLVLAMPVAWFLARVRREWRARLLLLIMVPFWTNFLIRVFAWNQILHSEGGLARFLRAIHLLGENDSLLFNSGAVVLVSVYTYLPFAILPLYAAAEKFDFGLLDAARDLGATALQAFRSVFLPGIRKGIHTALVIVFVPMLGSYVVPELVGGADGQMIGNKIAQRSFSDRNLPAASAMSVILTIAVLAPLLMRRRANGSPSPS
jgi:spermidine/putrescine transport system permease protein